MVGYNYRFVPAVALTRRLIDEGRLGRIHHFRARFADASFLDPEAPFTWHQDAEASGSNALLDLGSHLIDLARFLVGEPAAVSGATTTFVPERTDPATGRRRRVETEDAFEATVEFAGGALGSLSGTNMAAGRRAHMTFELNGSGGTVTFDLERINSLSVHLLGERPTGGGLREIHVTDADHPYGGCGGLPATRSAGRPRSSTSWGTFSAPSPAAGRRGRSARRSRMATAARWCATRSWRRPAPAAGSWSVNEAKGHEHLRPRRRRGAALTLASSRGTMRITSVRTRQVDVDLPAPSIPPGRPAPP